MEVGCQATWTGGRGSFKGIEDRYCDGEDQRSEALMKWVGKDGPQATYMKLHNVLLDMEEREAAEMVKKLARGNVFLQSLSWCSAHAPFTHYFILHTLK